MLTQHLFTAHTAAKPYICEVRGCRLSFYKKIELDRHVEQDHGSDSQEEDEDFITAAFAQDNEDEHADNKHQGEVEATSVSKRRRQRATVNDDEKEHTSKRSKLRSTVREVKLDDPVPQDVYHIRRDQVQGEDDWSYYSTPANSSSDMDITQSEDKELISAEIKLDSRIRMHVCRCECSHRLRTLFNDSDIVHSESRRLLEEAADIIRGIREQLGMNPTDE